MASASTARGAAGETGLTLAASGAAGAVVVGDAEAAGELIRCVARATGVVLPHVTNATAQEDAGRDRGRVLVGAEDCSASVRERLSRLGRDGYVIECRPEERTLELAGNGPDGTAFAVYELLERCLGVRWLWPGALGEVVPRAERVAVPAISVEREPAFVWRNLGPGGALWGRLDKWTKERELGVSEEHQRLQREWERRNRFGGERIYGGHAMGEILPPERYGPAHPEYFALVKGVRVWESFNGKHGKQPCTTNPEVIRITIDYCRRWLDAHPDYDGVSISPNDGRGFCECERCRALDTGEAMADREDAEAGRGGPIPVITDRMMTFANPVAEGLAETHPGKKVLLYAYGQYARPPVRVKAHPAVIVQYAMKAAGWWDEGARATAEAELEGWSRMAPTRGVYEYYTQTNLPDMPRPFPALIGQSVRRLAELGYRYFQTQAGDGHALNGLNFYVLARLLCEPERNTTEIVAEYVRSGFGAAAPAVGRFFGRLEEGWRRAGGSTVVMNRATAAEYRRVLAVYPPDLRAACRADLEEALAAERGEAAERVRFVEQGYRYFELTMEAIERTLPLLEAGWELGRAVVAPAGGDWAAYDSARRAWEERAAYVESVKDAFVLSYLWVKSNDETRSFNPLRAMRATGAQWQKATG